MTISISEHTSNPLD